MSEQNASTKNGRRLYLAFCGRSPGMLGDEAVLGFFATILEGEPYNFPHMRLRGAKDLLSLDIPDEKIEKVEEILQSLDICRKPVVALSLALVANETRRF